jgi:hypothetical protein
MPRAGTVVAWTGLTEALITLITKGDLLIFDDCLQPHWDGRPPRELRAACRRLYCINLLQGCRHYTIQIWP